MTLYKINGSCDTVWRKHYTPFEAGELTDIERLSENKFLISGYRVNPQLVSTGSDPFNPFIMIADSNGVPLYHYTDLNHVGRATASLLLPNGEIMFTGYEVSNANSLNFRIFIALMDSALNPKWYRQLLPNTLATQDGVFELLISNDGCGLALISEQLSNPNRIRPRLVKFDLSTGDTLQTKIIEPNGIANDFNLRFMKHYRQDIILSGSFRNVIGGNPSTNINGIIIKLDGSLNEKMRYTIPNQTLNVMAFLANGKFALVNVAAFVNPTLTRVYIFNNHLNLLDSSFQFQPTNVLVAPSIAQFEPNQWIAYGSTATSVSTFGQSDMYFSVINHSYGAPYVHDYCGADWPDSIRVKPEAGFTATATTDSIFFTNTSISGLQCQPQIAANEWFIDNYQFSDTGFNLGVPIA